MIDPNHDPRVFFAAERTLLAWLRTSITVIALGFVVARFALFLRAIRPEAPGLPPLWLSTALGVSMVAVGVAVAVMAGVQHHRFCRNLPPHDLPRDYLLQGGLWFAVALATLGLVLAVYLTLQGQWPVAAAG